MTAVPALTPVTPVTSVTPLIAVTAVTGAASAVTRQRSRWRRDRRDRRRDRRDRRRDWRDDRPTAVRPRGRERGDPRVADRSECLTASSHCCRANLAAPRPAPGSRPGALAAIYPDVARLGPGSRPGALAAGAASRLEAERTPPGCPWRQPGDWLIKPPIASTARHRPSPRCRKPLWWRYGPESGSGGRGGALVDARSGRRGPRIQATPPLPSIIRGQGHPTLLCSLWVAVGHRLTV